MDRGLSFGDVAERYERHRPGYPAELVPLVLAGASIPVRTAVEIGAGTGKATRVFAAYGIAVTAVEPDAAMLAVLERECVRLPVHALRAAYEEVDVSRVGSFDLLYAAAALHWTRPEGRWDRAVSMVRPGGVVASFGGPVTIAEPEVAAVEEGVLERHGVDIRVAPPSGGDGALDWPGDELVADGRFADVRQQVVPRRLSLSRADYLGHLDTVSAIRMLPVRRRTGLLAALADELPGTVPLNADLVVHTARVVGNGC
jgi:SAM-dependent methyltransferase